MNRTAWILAGLFVVLVVVIIFVVGSGEEEPTGPTTTTIDVTTTTGSGTTSPEAAPTTTTTGATSTTGPTTTTTTAVTTTTARLEGNWADEPLVVSRFGALGWWDGSGWVQVESNGALPVAGGEDYQVAFLGLEAIVGGGEPTTLCEPLNNSGVVVENEQVLGDWPGPVGVAISAPWILAPHLVEEKEDDGTYSAFAAALLAERGLDVAEPPIKQLLQMDLEGDGVNEILVVAEDVSQGLFAEDGDYSIAFMRRTAQGEVVDVILGESVIVTADDPVVNSYSVGAVADLSGDATMEVVLTTAYYEGLGVEVWERAGEGQGMAPVISAGCGV